MRFFRFTDWTHFDKGLDTRPATRIEYLEKVIDKCADLGRGKARLHCYCMKGAYFGLPSGEKFDKFSLADQVGDEDIHHMDQTLALPGGLNQCLGIIEIEDALRLDGEFIISLSKDPWKRRVVTLIKQAQATLWINLPGV